MWGEAILSANYLINRMISKNKEVSPYEMWKKEKPSYQHLNLGMPHSLRRRFLVIQETNALGRPNEPMSL